MESAELKAEMRQIDVRYITQKAFYSFTIATCRLPQLTLKTNRSAYSVKDIIALIFVDIMYVTFLILLFKIIRENHVVFILL